MILFLSMRCEILLLYSKYGRKAVWYIRVLGSFFHAYFSRVSAVGHQEQQSNSKSLESKRKRHGYVQTCVMETGIVVDILFFKLHLTIRNSVN